jgi:excisionase family DNA binding protein
MNKNNQKYVSIPELARFMGLSRIAIFKKVKLGEIKAIKIGRNYAISKRCVDEILGRSLSGNDKREIDRAVKKTVSEYAETLRLLSKG